MFPAFGHGFPCLIPVPPCHSETPSLPEPASVVGQGDGLSRTGRTNGLAPKGKAGGGKAYSRCSAGPGEAPPLGAAVGIVRDADGDRTSPPGGWREDDVDRAPGSYRH